MLKLTADIITKEVEPPASRHCASGHIAPETFRREGRNTPALPTRFFRITGKNFNNGIYCEPCYAVASYFARLKKNKRNERKP